MQQLEQLALLEQMIVEGALCRKASCVVLVEASRVAGGRGRRREGVSLGERNSERGRGRETQGEGKGERERERGREREREREREIK